MPRKAESAWHVSNIFTIHGLDCCASVLKSKASIICSLMTSKQETRFPLPDKRERDSNFAS